MSIMYRLTATETKLFFREPAIVFFTIAFAPALLVIIGLMPGMQDHNVGSDHLRPIDLFLPIVISMGIALLGLSGLPPLFASYRERGVLRRMRTTPVKPGYLIMAQLMMATILSAATTLIILVLARLIFGVALPSQLPAFVISYILLALSMFAIGLLIASIAPSARTATTIGTLTFFPMVFFAGLWVPRRDMNDVVRTISDLTPLGAGVQSLQDSAAGQWPQFVYLAVMLGWTIVAGGLAARYFRWE